MAGLIAGALVGVVAFVEIGLRLFLPFAVTNTGYVHTPNGERFGWGFEPGGLIRMEDPDTGVAWHERVNEKGWRDRARSYAKPEGRFRIVVVGDSNVFGFIVRGEQTATRVLEDMLRTDGCDVEVLNIATPGWGTDQALEAVRLEALKYAPDVVIHHVAPNDPNDNIWHTDTGKFGNRKPFYYELLDDGSVRRRDNPRFAHERDALTRKRIIAGSEILKRIWVAYRGFRHAGRPKYAFGAGQLERLRYFLGIDRDDPFHRALEGRLGEGVDVAEMTALVRRHGKQDQFAIIERILDGVSFNRRGMPDFSGPPIDTESTAWRLTFGLLREMRRLVESRGVRFALSIDQDLGRYDWERAWYAIGDDDESRYHFLAFDRAIRGFCADNAIPCVANRHRMERPRYDAHATGAGNRAMAMNFKEFLIERYPGLLARHCR